MSYYFNEEHELFRKGLKDFLKKEVLPYVDQWEEDRRIPKELWTKFGDMGYLGLNYPEKYGGVDGDFFYSVVFLEEIAKCYSGGLAVTAAVQQYMSSTYVFKHGSDFLKEKYLTKAISGEWICSIAITEPGAGSDVANIQTKAIKDESGDFYLVNGAKTFITSAYYGDFMIAVVKTDPEAGAGGVSLLLIDRNAEGVSARKLKKLGWHASDTAELNFDDVKVPAQNLIGQEGMGFYYLMEGLQLERLAGAILGVSGSEHALDYALEYMAQREAFGRKINRFQVLRHRIAQLATEIESIRQFTYYCCRLHNDKKYAVKESSMAKLLASELSDKATYQCLQFFGGYGYMEEYKIARMFRDSRIGTIGGGSSEIMREIIAKMIIDDKQYDSSKVLEKKAVNLQNGAPKNGQVTKIKGKLATQTTNSTSTEVLEKNNNQSTNSNLKTNKNTSVMSLEAITQGVKTRAENSPAFGNTIRFDFKDGGFLYLDGTGDGGNVVTNEEKDAECTVSITSEDFSKLLDGDLNPMSAFMTGRLKIKGNMGVAMKLQQLF